MSPLRPAGLALVFLTLIPPLARETRGGTESQGSRVAPARVVFLGDSITKGVRPGVQPGETFVALLAESLKTSGIDAELVNAGVGGERTDQALRRLDAVTTPRPRLVVVMYGTNDSYVDKGATASRITVDAYTANLRAIATDLRRRGIDTLLMTEPRWADDAPRNGLGESPNDRLAAYVAACRKVAVEQKVPLVDHFAVWTEARSRGRNLAGWTTDGCHPNPAGHRTLADAIAPTLKKLLAPPPAQDNRELTHPTPVNRSTARPSTLPKVTGLPCRLRRGEPIRPAVALESASLFR